ncbi:hypothetical protein TEA_008122 [Camellia sinensis var. sinensis]|uniref:RecF/RecN/SMC N-terminal domain-containing protein n=1 Tax=Camellia sinensis var. sinensis TaxID=542762 RepID=A0A4S4DAU2_CAMSN|nr:hypothetical protein TEA_008122 [Camellia sinensis var. sinensis]
MQQTIKLVELGVVDPGIKSSRLGGEESLSPDGLGLPSKLRCHCWGRFATSLDDLIPGSTTPNSTAENLKQTVSSVLRSLNFLVNRSGKRRVARNRRAPARLGSTDCVRNSSLLNVNNPQFVIMQGRITKVLNMKPPEILSMLEEAALKTLEKKQSKVDEIDKLLGQEILPALEKLKKERMQYMQWSDGNAELYRLKRFCVAFEYVQAEKIRDSAVHNVEELKGKIYEIDDKAERMCMEIREMETKVSKLTVEREDSMGGEVKSLLEKVDVLAHDLFVRSIEELKKSIEEKAYVVKSAEDGAAHQKKRLEQLDSWNSMKRITRSLSSFPYRKKFKDLKAQLELKSYDLSLFQSRAEQNEHLEFCKLVKRIEQGLLEAKSAANEKQLLYEECITTVSLLEKSICENTNNRDVKLKDLEKKMGKAQVQSASKDLKHTLMQVTLDFIPTEEDGKASYGNGSCQTRMCILGESVSRKQQINSLTSEVDGHKTRIASIRNAHDQAQSELNLFRSKMECDTQISCIPGEQQELQHKLSETNLERKKMENEVKRMEMEQKSCSLKVKKLIEKHAWITLEKHRFGRSGTDYDFASRDPHTAREDFEKPQAEQSDDFGSIFSTLLPGTMAKLEMPEGSSFLDGLEVCVAFGSVWKQSLSKLSGGQRSLLALSLILALLLLKPAPLYILDEFIVVSLKEGMFNNANILFRTMFVDGVSTVQRTVASKPNK